jgi:hypothetical protein
VLIGSRPSTHESGNATTSTAGGVVLENEATQSVPTDVAHVDIGVDVLMMHNHQNLKSSKFLVLKQ